MTTTGTSNNGSSGAFTTTHSIADWIQLPNQFELTSTITRVMLAKADQPGLDDCTEHLQLHASVAPSLDTNVPPPLSPDHSANTGSSRSSSPLSSPPSTRSSSPVYKYRRERSLSEFKPQSTETVSNSSSLPSARPSSSVYGYGAEQLSPTFDSQSGSTPSKRPRTRWSKKKRSNQPVQQNNPAPKSNKNAKAHQRRRKKRKLASGGSCLVYQVRPNTLIRVLMEGKPIRVKWNCHPDSMKSSGYIGRDGAAETCKVWKLEDLVGEGSRFKFQLIKWDGQISIPLIDSKGRIFAVLVGYPPQDSTWNSVHQSAADLLKKYAGQVVMESSDPSHCGVTIYLSAGYSFGGGQKYPKVFNQQPVNQDILEELLSAQCFQRISGHVSSAFATWAPKLYDLYTETISAYQAEDPCFAKTFPGTAFMAATFNFDEQTETVEHLDYFNYIFGWCGITSLGSFDYTKGGHLILWDLGLVIEFPPGTSILIPSCYLRHSNTATSQGENRYSFTEYSAGGLFRYNDDGMRTRVSMSDAERKQKEREARDKVSEGVNLYSTLNELLDSVQRSLHS